MSRAALEDHWRFDCEAFYFFCPTCGKQFKQGKHNCKQIMRDEKKTLQDMMQFLKDEMIRLEKEAMSLDKGGLEQIKRAHTADFNELLEDFFINIYQWLKPEDQKACLEDCTKVSEYLEQKGNQTSIYA